MIYCERMHKKHIISIIRYKTTSDKNLYAESLIRAERGSPRATLRLSNRKYLTN